MSLPVIVVISKINILLLNFFCNCGNNRPRMYTTKSFLFHLEVLIGTEARGDSCVTWKRPNGMLGTLQINYFPLYQDRVSSRLTNTNVFQPRGI